MKKLSHTDSAGKVKMVDVSHKLPQHRFASAQGEILLSPKTIKLIQENQMQKGDVLAVAKIAGIQAAKQTYTLIPLCHPLIIDRVNIHLAIEKFSIIITSEVFCLGKTGVEMEALTAVSVALLTVYDMCKAVDKNMQIKEIILLQKEKHDA